MLHNNEATRRTRCAQGNVGTLFFNSNGNSAAPVSFICMLDQHVGHVMCEREPGAFPRFSSSTFPACLSACCYTVQVKCNQTPLSFSLLLLSVFLFLFHLTEYCNLPPQWLSLVTRCSLQSQDRGKGLNTHGRTSYVSYKGTAVQ